ncbi:tyrosine-type recombinase/integrase [Streptomyces zhihengii]|uniref:tyrosine-type recombinase/integrase n=1 Tax=Streptomyces zhihengii TaxID=1818004 RepID=UPI0033A8DF0A
MSGAQRLRALKSFKALQARERLTLGEAYAESGYVLVHETGEAFSIKQLRRRAYRFMEALGLRRVRLYDARSSCLTYLANSGVPDHILARWAGHTNVKTTKKWCVKPDAEDLRDAATLWGGPHGAVPEQQVRADAPAVPALRATPGRGRSVAVLCAASR